MENQVLRGELERLFELDEMMNMSQDILGVSADRVGATASRAAFASALVDYCSRHQCLSSLVDAMSALAPDFDHRRRDQIREQLRVDPEMKPGEHVGEYEIVRVLGKGPVGRTYMAKLDGKDVTLKVINRLFGQIPAATARFEVACRLLARVEQQGLAGHLTVTRDSGRVLVGFDRPEGQDLASRVTRSGPMHINEVRGVFERLIEILVGLHEQRLTHGNIKASNVFVARAGQGKTPTVTLIDGGVDRLTGLSSALGLPLMVAWAPSSGALLAPEQMAGEAFEKSIDVFQLGALFYFVLSGKGPFEGKEKDGNLFSAGAATPVPLADAAPRGWVSKEVSAFVDKLIRMDPTERPKDAKAVAEAFEREVGGTGRSKAKSSITDGQLEELVDALIIEPESEEAASALDEAAGAGADVQKIVQAFMMAADQIEGDADEQQDAKKSLLFRAARLSESSLDDLEGAEKLYLDITSLDETDGFADAALEEVRKKLKKYEDVVEMLLVRVERAEEPEERAASMAEIGRLYAEDLDEPKEAVMAYAQAFAENPSRGDYADAVERLVGDNTAMLSEAVEILVNAAQGEQILVEEKNALLIRLGKWYGENLGTSESALQCYQAVIGADPKHMKALEGMATVYRSLQKYQELGHVLLRQVDAAPSAAQARDYRAAAADLLAERLDQVAKAKELYEKILEEDPGHEVAAESLLKIYEKEGDNRGVVQLLEEKAKALTGTAKAETLVRVGKLREKQLDDAAGAVKNFEAALEVEQGNSLALAALDDLYARAGRFKELVRILGQQVEIAETPRQKIRHLLRISHIREDEFLEHEQAVEALEQVLKIDPGNEEALDGLMRLYRVLDRWSDVARVYEQQLKVTTEADERLKLLLSFARMSAEQLDDVGRAIKLYEEVLEVDPKHAGALESLVSLREQSGDARAALEAIEALAAKADNPREKAERYVRAARILESQEDADGAIERYKKSLDAYPACTTAASALKVLYLDRGDTSAAIDLLEHEKKFAESNAVKARLAAEISKMYRNLVHDNQAAEKAAKEALSYDEKHLDALAVLGDLAHDDDRPLEAVHHYERMIRGLEKLSKEWATGILRRYVDALVRTDQAEKALESVDKLMEFARDDLDSMVLATRVLSEKGDPKKAFQTCKVVMEQFADELVGKERAQALYRYGESARKVGEHALAQDLLSEAADLDASSLEPLISLEKLHASTGDWEKVIKVKNRRLDVASGEERVDVLVEVGEVYLDKLHDQNQASKAFLAALDARPDDRKLLAQLAKLYSDTKDWAKLVDVVLKLAGFVSDPKQKAKYLHSAAMVAGEEMEEFDRAIELLDEVMKLDPDFDQALNESITFHERKEDFEGLARLLQLRVEKASQAEDAALVLKTLDDLASLYHEKQGDMEQAIEAYEAAQVLDPDNAERNSKLADLYASNPEKYLDKAIASQLSLLRTNANQRQPYKTLRRLYTEVKRADPAWNLCQALSVLKLADPDEERFYERMRSDSAAPAQDRLTDTDWDSMLMHENADPILTAILRTIEPAVLATRADTLENLGYDPRYAIDLARHPYPMSQTIYYAAGVLGVEPPPTFQNINDEGGISLLHAQVPSIVLGRAAFEVEVPTQAAAFIVSRHLTYYRPGLYVRHLVPTGTGLKAWVFAAIKMNSPKFPVATELEGPVEENINALNAHLPGTEREKLSSLVSKLLQAGRALDLKKWVASVDLTADRAGLLVCHDLEVATEMVKASDEGASPVNKAERLKELVLFSVSEKYFAIRQKLGIAIDS